MKPAISVQNISKQYRLGLAPSKDNNLTENLRLAARNAWDKVRRLATPKRAIRQEESFWALKDVSFEVMPGEVVGIIGRNGAGKSTLLKVLSHIVEPTAGYADIRGRMGSLLEVGTGFHPELTGRENIYLNGAILGMKREEINRKFDEIVAFAEVEKFLDTPVKRYSSGMYVRLAFSVAAHLEPEILIVDEVLAVGDAEFQKKCIQRMSSISSKHGTTVLFVSHNISAIRTLTTKCIYLSKGSIKSFSKTDAALADYTKALNSRSIGRILENESRQFPHYGKKLLFLSAHPIYHINASSFYLDESKRFMITLRCCNVIEKCRIGFTISDSQGIPIATGETDSVISFNEMGDYRVILDINSVTLSSGVYQISISIGVGTIFEPRTHFDVVNPGIDFEVNEIKYDSSCMYNWMHSYGSIYIPPNQTKLEIIKI